MLPQTALARPDLVSTYRQRHCTFSPNPNLVDEKCIDHAHRIVPHYERENRCKISHRDLGHLSLIADVTRVQYGYYLNDPACLITFRFQFQGSTPHWRFGKADIRILFEAIGTDGHDGGEGGGDEQQTSSLASTLQPVILDYGPKHLVSAGTLSQESTWYSASLSASSAPSPIPLLPLPGLSIGHSTSHPHHTAASVSSASMSSYGHVRPNIVKFWIREDPLQRDGVPMDFDCAVAVKYAGTFRAEVEVKAGPVFDWLAKPWSRDEPVVFEPGVDYGEPVMGRAHGGGGSVDFDKLTLEEWRSLVTPRLGMVEEQVLYGVVQK